MKIGKETKLSFSQFYIENLKQFYAQIIRTNKNFKISGYKINI